MKQQKANKMAGNKTEVRGKSTLTPLLGGDNHEERFFRALLVIEHIAMHNEELPKHINTDMEKKLHDAITTIYRVAHVGRIPGCINVHEKWEKEFKGLVEFTEADKCDLPEAT